MGKEYDVRLTSKIENNFSQPAIKYFKDCVEIKEQFSRETDGL